MCFNTGGRWIDTDASDSSAAAIAVEPVFGVARNASRSSQNTSIPAPFFASGPFRPVFPFPVNYPLTDSRKS